LAGDTAESGATALTVPEDAIAAGSVTSGPEEAQAPMKRESVTTDNRLNMFSKPGVDFVYRHSYTKVDGFTARPELNPDRLC
jgi:hypothetical protein